MRANRTPAQASWRFAGSLADKDDGLNDSGDWDDRFGMVPSISGGGTAGSGNWRLITG
jgi:hypothetical protein